MKDFSYLVKPLRSYSIPRDDLSNTLLAVLGWMALPGLLISLLRIFELGWLPSMGFQILVVAIVWILVILRKKLPYQVKISIIVVFWLLQGVYGIINYGLSGGGLGFLLTLVILLTLMVSFRTGFLTLLGVFLFLGGMMLCLQQGWINFNLDFNVYNRAFSSWAGALILMGFWSGAVLFVAHRLHSLLESEMEKTKLSEQKFQIIMDQVPDVISLIDSRGTLLFNSSASQRIHGWTHEDLTGRDTFELIHPQDRDRVLEAMKNILQNPESLQAVQYRYLNKDGTYTWMEATARNELHNPGLQSLVTISRDISQNKKAQAERESLIQELISKNGELERFIYSVSHDLKAPLITVLGFLGYAKISLKQGNVERTLSDLDRVALAVGKIEDLLEDLLELSSVGKEEHPPMDFNMASALKEALVSLEKPLKDPRVQVILAPDFPYLRGDLVRVVKIWQNLVENAVKFRSPSRDLILEAGWENTPEGSKYFLRDNGIGIEPAYREKIFELFEQLNPRSEGTGLGLALVRKIVEAHGGSVWVESVPGEGSTFFFTLGDTDE